jgi:hypothetical protein
VATKAQIVKSKRKPKFSVRSVRRCFRCGKEGLHERFRFVPNLFSRTGQPRIASGSQKIKLVKGFVQNPKP